MNDDLRRRVLVTLGLLALSRVLLHVPVPGVDLRALANLGVTFFGFRENLLHLTGVGVLGITPYIVASTFVTLGLLLFGRAASTSAFWGEPATVLLAFSIAFLSGAGNAVELQNAAARLVPHPGILFVIGAGLTQAAGVLIMIAIARIISTHGVGNGVCLLFATSFVGQQTNAFVSRIEDSREPMNGLGIGLAIVVWLVVSIVYLLARWQASESPRPLMLHVNGVGMSGIAIASQIILVGNSLVALIASTSLGPRWVGTVLFVAIAFVATTVLIAWAYDSQRLPAAAVDRAELENSFERRVERVMLPCALAACVLVVVFGILMSDFHAPRVSAVLVFTVAAIILDTEAQVRARMKMAPPIEAVDSEGEMELLPIEAVDSEAETELSPIEAVESEDETELPPREEWVVASQPETRLAADSECARLEAAGVRAILIANTSAPLSGTLGLFEINPVVPLFPHRELGGGGFRVMVPFPELDSARALLEGSAEPHDH